MPPVGWSLFILRGRLWGSNCASPCSHRCASDTCNVINGSCTFCNGSWGEICDKLCSEGCSNKCLQSDGTCLCKDGYWGMQCTEQCSDGCLLDACNQTDGTCAQCRAGRWGILCDRSCISNCKLCNVNDTCITCMDRYWGDTCTSCDNKCADTCDKSTGYCTCISGYYNVNKNESKCKTCYENCHNQACDPESGVCHQGCVDGFWGDYCNIMCNNSCNSTCAQDTGFCKGCSNKSTYGPLCDQQCSLNCLLSECEQISGNCTLGCYLHHYWVCVKTIAV